ncbi:protein FAR1-RELATED SEQUENCE 5-like [Apium graveolens]|uniref:protein FAR1-RELATED SEQUENCE 5-like n=1 Tax=Apium graveolens TaxID=4045 RepID=UPI003D78FEE8
MADKLFARMFRHKRQNEKKEAIDCSLHLDSLNSSEPKTPVYVEDDDFVDRNEQFINLDDDLVDVEDESDGNEVENEVENDSDNVEGEDEIDNVEDANLAYALRNGFAIKIQASHRNKDNEIYGRLYVCRLYGKSVVAESSQNKRRREVLPKSECKVRMYVNYQKKKRHWEVTSLELVHNHGLVSPSKMNLVQRERHVNTATRSLIKTLYGSGVRNCQVMNVIGNIHGGNDKVGFNVQHVRNVLRDERMKRFEISDAQAGLDLLHRLNEESGSKYFIRTEVDEENRLKCLVWIDPRCIMAYQNFGDVMAFDTTYRTNRYAMPFVPFTGVNHHYQSVIFGFALMRDEHASTFEWILRTWLEGVGNNPPLTIITDQDQAMASAIAVVLPNTTHLLCSWHISQKFPEKLAHYYSAFPEFKTDFNNCIYKSLTECVFEARWASFVEKYHLQDHKWLKGLYELKHKWIPAYTRNKFSAFQNSTSRSEGMNSFFDKYVSSATGLKEFIENAQKALARLIHEGEGRRLCHH